MYKKFIKYIMVPLQKISESARKSIDNE